MELSSHLFRQVSLEATLLVIYHANEWMKSPYRCLANLSISLPGEQVLHARICTGSHEGLHDWHVAVTRTFHQHVDPALRSKTATPPYAPSLSVCIDPHQTGHGFLTRDLDFARYPDRICFHIKAPHLVPPAPYSRPSFRWVLESLVPQEGHRRSLPSRYC
jgi:hypothetical protein